MPLENEKITPEVLAAAQQLLIKNRVPLLPDGKCLIKYDKGSLLEPLPSGFIVLEEKEDD